MYVGICVRIILKSEVCFILQHISVWTTIFKCLAAIVDSADLH